jgi:hypothetical protein
MALSSAWIISNAARRVVAAARCEMDGWASVMALESSAMFMVGLMVVDWKLEDRSLAA